MVKSVDRAIRILELLSENNKMGITEISKKLNLPKTTTFDIVSTLHERGILEKDEENNRYFLGLKLFELGDAARANFELRKIAVPYLKELNSKLDETVHLTVRDDDEVLYIECFESTKRLRTYSVIGVRAPLYCTAVGKALLAFLPDEEIKKIVRKKGFIRFTPNTITDEKRLFDEIKKIRELGYSIDDVEHEEGVRCVGAPIRDHTGRVVASISVSGPTQRVTKSKVPQLAKIVMATAEEISSRLGYKKPV
ncbi:MAG: IclR family transcriptional regulator [Spirochaetes bacterium]|nr:MAG: IclR family transcriptional regulator [Spirochaetota bacterium]